MRQRAVIKKNVDNNAAQCDETEKKNKAKRKQSKRNMWRSEKLVANE